MPGFDNKFDRYPYSAIVDRPVFDWPNGKRLAVYFALNIEAFEFGRNPGPDFTTMPTAPFHRGYAYRDFGNRVGVWRILDLFKSYGLPLAVIANASVYDAAPRVIDACREAGHELIGHGRTNSERQIDMSEEDERAMLREVVQRFEKEEGSRPSGWLGPFLSQSAQTPELLKEAGFTYMLDWFFDEQPVSFRTDNGPILAVPYPSMEMNDLPAYINRGMSDDEFAQMLIDGFDEQLSDSRKHPLIFSASLHTFLTGQPQRTRQLRKVLDHIQSKSDEIWFTTPGEIAKAALGRAQDGVQR